MDKKISQFTLERYRLGELGHGDNLIVKEALERDKGLRDFIVSLDESDHELRLRYSFENLGLPKERVNRSPFGRVSFMAVAAAAVLCIIFPLAFFLRPSTQGPHDGLPQDRAKGSALEGIELSLYLRGGPETPLPEQTILHEGNTVQLAYSAPAGEYYGVIFSIDGRSEVTMHYPYRMGQSSLLVSGRRTYLNEAYTLDDAPGFELFVIVVSAEPLDAEEILWEARSLVNTGLFDEFINEFIDEFEEEIKIAFEGSEVETLMMLKN
jgi:hypothetical protein